MARFKQHYWLTGIFLLFFFHAFATNTNPLRSNVSLVDTVYFHVSSAQGNVGDVVSINVKVGSFINVYNLSQSLKWNNSYLQFESLTVGGLPNATPANFNTTQAATLGKIDLNWSSIGETIPDSTIIYTVNLKIISYSGLPVAVLIPNVVVTDSRGQTTAKVSNGTVKINNTGQCQGRAPGLTCLNAPLLCEGDFPYCNTLPTANIPFPSGGCGSIENAHVFYFDAGSTSVTFKVKASSCTTGPLGNGSGLQFRVYETSDCISFRQVYCGSNDPIAPGFESPIVINDNGNGLVIGKRYLMMVDGQRNDICDYTIEITAGSIGGKPNLDNNSISGPSSSCPNQANLNFSTPNRSDALAYQWTVTGGNITTGQGTNAIKVNWGAGTGSVSLKIIGTCGESNTITKNIGLSAPTQGILDTTICKGGKVVINGQEFTTAIERTVTIPNGSFTGCDSIVNLKLKVIDISATLSKTGDLSCETASVTLSANVTVLPSNTSIGYQWLSPSNVQIGNTPSVSVTQAGVYTLKVIGFNGVNCENTFTIQVNKTGNVPTRPEMRGDVATCENKPFPYNIANPIGGITYNWTIQGGTINSGAGTQAVSVNWGATASGKICVEAENGCGKSDTTCLSISIGKQPTALTINGGATQTVCPAANATYTTTASTNVTNYLWSIPAGATITRGQGTPSIDINWGTSTGGQVCLIPSNNCGAATQSCITVEVKNAVPDSIPMTGSTTVCPAETTTISVTPNASITKYTWIVPTNATIISGQGTPSVSVRFDSGTETLVTVEIENVCQLKRQLRHLVKIKNEPPTALTIFGNAAVCSNDISTYGVTGNASITRYTWSVPTGATIVSGQGTQTLNVSWGAVQSGKVILEIANACDLKTQSFIDVSVKNSTIDDFLITGANEVCPNASATYSIPTNTRYRKYKWILPANASLSGVDTTNSLSVTWSSTGTNDICIEVTNDCNVTRRVCYQVAVKAGIDSLPINGNREVCTGNLGTYTVQKDPDAISYVWFVPAGATIETGRGTNQITVRFGTSGGLIRVQPIGGCATNASSFAVSIKKAPDAPASITGKSIVCQGEEAVYELTAVIGATGYKWIAPAGASIVGSDSSQQVRVRWASTLGGKLQVKSRNECNESIAKEYDVTVNSAPSPKAGADEAICGNIYTFKGINSIGNRLWTNLTKPANATISYSDATNINSVVTVSLSGIYTFKFEEKNGECIASDTVTITFKANPKLTLVNDNCNTTGTQYVLNINITGGQMPYNLQGNITGTVSNTTIISNPILEGTNYSVYITDASGCHSDTLQGTKRCPCTTKAASLRTTPIAVCEGAKGKIDIQNNAVLDADDMFEYVLHDGTANQIGTVLLKNQTGEFDFDATKLTYNKIYFVHYRVGNNVSGSISTTDRCYAQSNGVSIVFKSKAIVDLKGDTVVCANTPTTLTFKANQANLFKVVFRNEKESIDVTLNSARNNTASTVTPSVSTTYKLISVTDENGCVAQIRDSVMVNVRPRLTGDAGIDQSVCTTTAQLKANIPTSYKITWRSLSNAVMSSTNNAMIDVTNLKSGKNTFVMTIQDSVCANYRFTDSVSVFLPTTPNALNLSLEMFMGDTLVADVTEQAPAGTYTVTRLTNPINGRFDLFSSGRFSYISDKNFAGIAKFNFQICSEACPGLCDTGDVRILIKQKPVKPDTLVDIVVPNAITPNDDGKNDVLIIDKVEKYLQGELIVFNRWGDVLYRSKPYNNDWNGTNQQGQPLPEGTYYYVLRLDLNNSKVLRGDITILR